MATNKGIAAPLFGLLTLIFIFLGIASWIFQARLASWICLLLGLVSLIIFVRLRFSAIVDFFISRQARYGANVALSIVGVIGIAVFVNAIVVQRFDKRVDVTLHQLYTLSETDAEDPQICRQRHPCYGIFGTKRLCSKPATCEGHVRIVCT